MIQAIQVHTPMRQITDNYNWTCKTYVCSRASLICNAITKTSTIVSRFSADHRLQVSDATRGFSSEVGIPSHMILTGAASWIKLFPNAVLCNTQRGGNGKRRSSNNHDKLCTIQQTTLFQHELCGLCEFIIAKMADCYDINQG